MHNLNHLSIADAGVLCSLGSTPSMVVGAINAGIAMLDESHLIGGNASAYRMSLVPDTAIPALKPSLDTSEINHKEHRLLALAGHAITESVKKHAPIQPIPLFIATPELIPRSTSPISESFVQKLSLQTEVEFDLNNSRIIPYGRSGGIYALELAFNYLNNHDCEHVLIGGVDSYLDLRKLALLNAVGRVKTNGLTNGFFPGEGACFLLLSKTRNQTELGYLSRPAYGIEKAHIYSDKPHLGESLSSVVRGALANQTGKIERIFSSQNGEQFYAKEFGVMMARNSNSFSDAITHHHPNEFYGDIGAASITSMILLAAQNNTTSLVYGASDMGQRAAVCVN